MTWALVTIFIAGYLMIILESVIKINKAAIALITGVACWAVYIIFSKTKDVVSGELTKYLGEISGILFFLMAAMAIVELIDAHDGFEIIYRWINRTNKLRLLWIISLITFFLSPVLNNLTTAIVMISLLRKFITDPKERIYFACMIILAANTGGVWSPIGDVTSTMLWMGGQVSPLNMIIMLFLPSLFCLLTPLLILSFRLKKKSYHFGTNEIDNNNNFSNQDQYLVFFSGLVIFISVPVFQMLTGLQPYMGMLIGLGILWVITEIIHSKKDEDEKQILSVSYALQKIDTPSILFFLGILLSISAMNAAGILKYAAQIFSHLGNQNMVAIVMGILSSVVDNVPLVAASQGMYSLHIYPVDHPFWIFLAYCTGTGGSLLLIGSAAGVAVMGMEKISFFWYLKKFTWLALIGFVAGIVVYLFEYFILNY